MTNEGYLIDIIPIWPSGTNSKLFTSCCSVAICDWELCCSICKRKVVGADAESEHERHETRWSNATRFWNRS